MILGLEIYYKPPLAATIKPGGRDGGLLNDRKYNQFISIIEKKHFFID
jgi:hypothetical protein